MKIKSSYLSFVFFLCVAKVHAQEEVKGSETKSKAPISLSYYGNTLVHKGAKLSIDWVWLEVVKTRGKKDKRITRGLYTTPNVSFYKHKDSHTGLRVGVDGIWRRSKTKGFREFGIGLGYFRRFNAGETWEVSSDGSVTNLKGASRGYLSPSFSVATGRTFVLKNETMLTPFIRWNVDILFGYNSGSLPTTSLEIGCRIINKFSPKRGNYKIIEKASKKKKS